MSNRVLRLLILPLLLLAIPATGLVACAPDFRPMGAQLLTPTLDNEALIMADGARLPLKIWHATGQPRAIVLALHGFTDYANAFALPAASWATLGITTYAYDQRGFGAAEPLLRWAGAETYARDARQALILLRRRFPDTPLYLLGESMGGSTAILALTDGTAPQPVDDRPLADGLVLIAPGILDQPALSAAEHDVLDFAAHLVPWAMSGKRGIQVWPTDNRPLLRQMAADPLMQKEVRFDQIYGLLQMIETASQRLPMLNLPTLALFGDHDQILPPQAEAFFQQQVLAQIARGQITVEHVTGGYHMLLRDLEAMPRQEAVAAWLLLDHPQPSVASETGSLTGQLPEPAGGEAEPATE